METLLSSFLALVGFPSDSCLSLLVSVIIVTDLFSASEKCTWTDDIIGLSWEKNVSLIDK